MENQSTGIFTETKSRFAFINWLRSVGEWLWRKPKNPFVSVSETRPALHIDYISEPHNDYERKLNNFDDELMIPELQSNFMANKRFMLDCGRRDGALGIESTDLEIIAHTHAQNLFDQASVVLNGKVAALKTEEEARLKIKNRDEFNNNEQQEYFSYLEHGYRYFPKTFSIVLGIIYFLSFIVLTVADIPLALRLIIDGFNLHSDGKLKELFSDNTWDILKSNWEVLFTAFGITMCAVYIKVFYDEFIGTSYGSKYVSRHKFNQIYADKKVGTGSSITGIDMDSIDKEGRNKKVWKYVLAVCTILTLIALSLFRIHTLSLYEVDKITKEQVLLVVPSGWQLDAAILALTLIFPIIGGICLSLSLNNFQNFIRFKKAKVNCDSAYRHFIESLKAYTETEKKCKILEAELVNWSTESKRVDNHKQILLAYYRYGKMIGNAEPDRYMSEKDFFEKVKLWREKSLSRRINNKIIQLK